MIGGIILLLLLVAALFVINEVPADGSVKQ
jgi:hypothetical protein